MLELNKIHLGDCLDLMGEIPDGSVDMILCDLPYKKTSYSWDTIIPFKPLWAHYERIITDVGGIVLTAIQPFTSLLVTSNLKLYSHNWVWKKTKCANFILGGHRPMYYTEDVLVFSKGSYHPLANKIATYNPILREGQAATNNGQEKSANQKMFQQSSNPTRLKSKKRDKPGLLPINLIEFASVSKPIHPTQKPVPLFSYFVETYSSKGDVILDNCIGSGTTAISALETGRQFIGIEKDPEHRRVAVERVEKWKSEYRQLELKV